MDHKISLIALVAIVFSALDAFSSVTTPTPKGDVSVYSRTELKKDLFLGEVWDSGIVDSIYFDSNDVYIRDLLTECADGTYIKGTITSGDRLNGEITFENGAQVSQHYKVYCATYDEYGDLVCDKSVATFAFNIEDGVIMSPFSESTWGTMILLGESDSEWSQFQPAAIIESFTPVEPQTAFVIPEGIEWRKYEFYNTPLEENDPVKTRFIRVGRDGNDFYITDFIERFPTVTLKGSLGDDNVVEFVVPSYLGIHNNHFCELHTGTGKPNFDKFGLFTYYTYDIDDIGSIYMDYNPDDESLVSDGLFIVATGDKAFPGHMNAPQLILSHEIDQTVVPEGVERMPYQMLSLNMAIPGNEPRTPLRIEVAKDGSDIYFINFDPMYPGLAFKGTYNADGSAITVDVPQYLGKSQYDDDVYLYTVATDVQPDYFYDGFYMVNYQTNDAQRRLTFTVDGDVISSNDNLAAAPQFGTAYYGMIKAQFSPYVTGERVHIPDGADGTNYLATSHIYPGSSATASLVTTIYKDDDDYYVKGINPLYPDLVFKGEYSPDKNAVKVPMPQYMGDDAQGNNIFLSKCIARAKDPGWGGITSELDVDFSPTDLWLTIDGDSFVASETFCAVPIGAEVLNAMIDATFTVHTEAIPAVPTDAVVEQYAFTRTVLDGWTGALRPVIMEVAHKDNAYYLVHNLESAGKVIIKGELKDNKILIPTDQYVGVTLPVYICAGDVTDDYWSFDYRKKDKDYIEMAYDAATGGFSTRDNIVFYMDGGRAVEYFGCPAYSKYAPKAEAPLAPKSLEWRDRTGWWGPQFDFIVDIPCEDQSGCYLDVNAISYRLYFDNDIYVFNPSDYPFDNFDGPTTELPYTWNSNAITASDSSTEHIISVYAKPNRHIGIQSSFTQNGTTYWGPIVKLDIVTSAVTQEDAAGEIQFGYATTEPDATWGTTKGETYDVAISLCSPDLVGKTVKGVTIPVVDSNDLSDYSVWITRNLKVNNKTNVPDVLSVAVAPQGDKIELTFDTPYTITEDGCYVGYSFMVNNLTDATRDPIVVSQEVSDGGFFIHTTNTYRTWADRSSVLGVTSGMLVTVEGDFPKYAAALADIPAFKALVESPITLPVNVINHGTSAITEIEYSYNIDTAYGTGTVKLDTPIPAVYNRHTTVDIELPALYGSGSYPLTLKITKVNGNRNGDVLASATSTINVVSALPVNLPVVEEWTGTWCGWCIKGIVALEKMKSQYPDDFIAIAYHNNDGMMLSEGYPDMTIGFPNAYINRTESGDPYYMNNTVAEFGLESAWLRAKEAYVPVDLKVTSAVATDETVKVNTSVQWIEDAADGEYAIEYVLLADDVTGSGDGWIQQNYFSGQGGWGEDFDEYYALPPVIPDLHFNDVAILNSGSKGVDGSIPDEIIPDTPIEHEYTFDITNVVNYKGKVIPFDKEKLRVVAMLIRRNADYGKVINATKLDVTYISGINDIPADAQIKSVEYYDLMGRQVLTPTSGMYIKVITLIDGKVYTQKTVK